MTRPPVVSQPDDTQAECLQACVTGNIMHSDIAEPDDELADPELVDPGVVEGWHRAKGMMECLAVKRCRMRSGRFSFQGGKDGLVPSHTPLLEPAG